MSGFASRVYPAMPRLVQNCLCTARGVREYYKRYHGRFREFLRRLEESQWWPADRLREYQDERLRETLRLAYEEVPFWRARFDRLGIVPADIRTVESLKEVPILTKAEAQDAAEDLWNPRFRGGGLVRGHTSGSTGTPLELVCTKDCARFQWALWWRHKRWYGIQLHHRQANFGWQPVVPYDQVRPPFWRHNWWGRQTVFSHYHLKPDFLGAYVEYLNSHPFDYFSGYPSTMYVLADYCETSGRELRKRPKMVFAGSENVEGFQRELMEKHLGPVRSHYGGAEYAANASQCPMGFYHVDMECGILEVVPLEGVAQEPGRVRGRIVVTGFTNPAMPLIRYDMADVATLLVDYQCPCGRQSPVLEAIDGRSDSCLVTVDGRRVGRISQVFMGREWVREAQIVQNRAGTVVVNIVRRRDPAGDEVAALKRDIRRYMGEDALIDVNFVANVPRTSAGKFRAVVSTVGGLDAGGDAVSRAPGGHG